MMPKQMWMEYIDFLQQQEEGGVGYCIVCHGQHEGYVDPDGRDMLCQQCGAHGVHGLDEILMMGLIMFTGDDE